MRQRVVTIAWRLDCMDCDRAWPVWDAERLSVADALRLLEIIAEHRRAVHGEGS